MERALFLRSMRPSQQTLETRTTTNHHTHNRKDRTMYNHGKTLRMGILTALMLALFTSLAVNRAYAQSKKEDIVQSKKRGSKITSMEMGTTSSFSVSNSSSDTLLYVQDDGNVGIGTTSPTASLDVVDYIKVSNSFGNRLFEAREESSNLGIMQVSFGNVVKAKVTSNGDSFFNGGNVGIGTIFPNYKLEVSGAVMLEDGSTPSSASGHSGIYSSSGELFALDGAGNSTQISPHDKETGEWIFYSKNIKTGRVVRINMERLVKKIEEITGERYIEEWIEE